jgi:hypothetical protein
VNPFVETPEYFPTAEGAATDEELANKLAREINTKAQLLIAYLTNKSWKPVC